MPPSEFFFSKKRRAVVRRETHQRDGATVKKHMVLLDVKALEEEDFTTDVAGSLGAFATTNQFSVGNLKEKLKQKDLLVSQLQGKIETVEQEVGSEMTKSLSRLEPMKGRKFNNSVSTLMRYRKSHRQVGNWSDSCR